MIIQASVQLILMNNAFQISDDKSWQYLKQPGIFTGNYPLQINKPWLRFSINPIRKLRHIEKFTS
ncbi:MAG TPA: hypothetical protein DF409_10040 [Bacteroidales bacterium]|nr:hypothetical protein [Bacteroidales bacterium]